MKKILTKGLIAALSLTLLVVSVAGCGTSNSASTAAGGAKKGPTIKIGSKTFTEQLLLGTLLYDYLQGLGYPVENKTGLGEAAVIRPALTSGQIDVYWEYTNTCVTDFMKHDPVFDAKQAYDLVKDWDAKNGLVWLPYAPLNDTYGVVVRPDVAQKYNLKTISDWTNLIKSGTHLKFVSFTEWDEREDGLPRFETAYNTKIPKDDVVEVAMGLNYDALANKKGDLALVFTTEPRIVTDKLVLLKDDKNAFAVYNASPVFRKQTLDAYPDLANDVNKLSAVLDTDTITDLNKQVDVDKKGVEDVSKTFLKSKGLLK